MRRKFTFYVEKYNRKWPISIKKSKTYCFYELKRGFRFDWNLVIWYVKVTWLKHHVKKPCATTCVCNNNAFIRTFEEIIPLKECSYLLGQNNKCISSRSKHFVINHFQSNILVLSTEFSYFDHKRNYCKYRWNYRHQIVSRKTAYFWCKVSSF